MKARLLGQSVDIRTDEQENYPSTCSFSPDGLALLTKTVADAKLRLYNTFGKSGENEIEDRTSNEVHDPVSPIRQLTTELTCDGGDAVRSTAWYPHMKSSDPTSCCFLAAARNQPIHLFDAYTGSIRASYRPYNDLDEMESATVTLFDPSGRLVVASGFRSDRTIHMFQANFPGRDSTVLRLGKTRRSSDGQKGLVSAMTYVGTNHLVVGTYSPGSIYIYDERSSQQPTGTILNGRCIVGHGRSHARKKRLFAALERPTSNTDEEDKAADDDDLHLHWINAAKIKWFQTRTQSGVTQLQADNSEFLLYSTSRRSNAIISWDLRMLSGNIEYQSRPIAGYSSFATQNDTNQRLEFALDESGQTLFAGGTDRKVRVYDTKSGNLQTTIDGLDDVANGVSFAHMETAKASFLAVTTGSRHFPSLEDLEQEIPPLPSASTGCLRLYKWG